MKKMERVKVNIKEFAAFHKKRISLLNYFLEEKIQGRLIYQISFLGFESLAKLLYSKEHNPKKRFVSLLSIPNIGVSQNEAEKLWDFWRNSLTHQGFIVNPYTTLEGWNEDDSSFLSFPDKFRSSVELPPGSIASMYKVFINYFNDFCKKNNIEMMEISWEEAP